MTLLATFIVSVLAVLVIIMVSRKLEEENYFDDVWGLGYYTGILALFVVEMIFKYINP